jgi:DNA-binding transcriptional regulator YiaG
VIRRRQKMTRHTSVNVGEANAMARLTEDDVRFIRRDATMSQPELAQMFGVTQSHISRVKRGEFWRHVND